MIHVYFLHIAYVAIHHMSECNICAMCNCRSDSLATVYSYGIWSTDFDSKHVCVINTDEFGRQGHLAARMDRGCWSCMPAMGQWQQLGCLAERTTTRKMWLEQALCIFLPNHGSEKWLYSKGNYNHLDTINLLLEGPIFHFHDHGRKSKHIKEALKDTSKSWYVRLLGKNVPVKTPWLPTRIAVFYSQIHQHTTSYFRYGNR